MRKRLAILAIAVFVAVSVSGQPNKAPYPDQHPANPEHTDILKTTPKKQNEATSHKTETNVDPPEWYTAIKRPEWWLVIVGFGTLIVVGWQTRILGRSVAVAEKSVNAFVSKERAWIFMRAKITDDLNVTFYAENRGASPAYFTSGFVDCEVFDRSVEFPKEPDYTYDAGEWLFSVEDWSPWLPANSEREIGGYDAAIMQDVKGQEFFDKVTSGKFRLWFYGIVRYRDNISPIIHKTKFCMACFINDYGEAFIHERGPEEYNRKT